MSQQTTVQLQADDASVASIARRARAASRELAKLSTETRNEVLKAAAKAIEAGRQRILDANERDRRAAEPAVAAGKLTPAMLARLRVSGGGTTLVEAIHLGRDAIGIEYEPRWAAIAAANITCARRQDATGEGEAIRGDARQLPAANTAELGGRR